MKFADDDDDDILHNDMKNVPWFYLRLFQLFYTIVLKHTNNCQIIIKQNAICMKTANRTKIVSQRQSNKKNRNTIKLQV